MQCNVTLRKVEKWSWIHTGIGSTPKCTHFYRVTSLTIGTRYSWRPLTHSFADRRTNTQTHPHTGDHNTGRLKTRDWKTRDHQKCRGGKRGTGKRGTVLKGMENEGPKCRGGKRRTGKHGTIIPGVENATSSYGKPKLQVYLVITNA